MITKIIYKLKPEVVSQDAVCETDKLLFYQERGERLLKEDADETLYDRYKTQVAKLKGTLNGERLEGLLYLLGSAPNSSVVRKGIKTLVEQMEYQKPTGFRMQKNHCFSSNSKLQAE